MPLLLGLRVGFLKRKLKTGLKNLYHTFWLCFYKKNKGERIALFLKRDESKIAKRAIRSF